MICLTFKELFMCREIFSFIKLFFLPKKKNSLSICSRDADLPPISILWQDLNIRKVDENQKNHKDHKRGDTSDDNFFFSLGVKLHIKSKKEKLYSIIKRKW